MSLAHLMKTALPMNRKERFFTGTVFPGIVCKKDFQDLGVLALLIPGCVLPPIDPHPATTNIQFFTEYSLVESIYGNEAKERFPTPPTSKDTPDILILVSGEPTVLIALEAKMYDQPSAPKLTEQMRAQRVQLDYLRQHLALDAVHHAALLPRGLADKIAGDLPTSDRMLSPSFCGRTSATSTAPSAATTTTSWPCWTLRSPCGQHWQPNRRRSG